MEAHDNEVISGAGDAPPERDVPLTADQQKTVSFLTDGAQWGDEASTCALKLIDELRASVSLWREQAEHWSDTSVETAKRLLAERARAERAEASLARVEAERLALVADLQWLEALYDRDGIAHVHARQMEKIFDRWLHDDTDTVGALEAIRDELRKTIARAERSEAEAARLRETLAQLEAGK